jgi:multidrug efflux pump subunit AcrA (membrane-fusion protein)
MGRSSFVQREFRRFLVALMLVVDVCGRTESPGGPPGPPAQAVVVETAERRDVPIVVDLVARTEAAAEVAIRANVEGRLVETCFQEGHMVQKGQTLFRIDPRRCDSDVQLAQSRWRERRRIWRWRMSNSVW